MWNWQFAVEVVPALLEGLKTTVLVSICAFALAAVGGLILVAMRLSGVRLLAWSAKWITEFLRGTPVLVQLFFVYYGLAQVGILIPAFETGVIVLGASFSAYLAEVYRAGIDAIPVGQVEVSKILGYSPSQIWARVLIPQGLRNSIPAMGSYAVYMFKETALLSVIAVSEVLQVARQIGSEHYRYVEPFVVASLLYFVVSYSSVLLLRWTEKKLEYA